MWLASLIVRLIRRIITLPFLPMLLKYDRAQSEAAAQRIIIIPDHLIESILVQLPVKTLLRFRRLSKQWNSTITSPSFATMHLNNILITPWSISAPSRRCAGTRVVYLDYSAQHRFFPSERAYLYTARIPINLARLKRRVYIERPRRGWTDTFKEFNASCNGLVCMARVSIIEYRVRATILIQVWNLATGKHKQVASLPASLLSEMSGRACITMTELIMLGFGYDSTINDFKIVFMYKSSVETTWQVQVMSLKSNMWKSVDFNLISDVRCVSRSFSNAVSVAGNVYWPVKSGQWCTILKCILGEERFELLSLPGREGKSDYNSHVAEVSKLGCHNGSLYIFIQKHGKVDIWILLSTADDASEIKWRRVATVTIPECDPLGFDCNGHVIMCVTESPYGYQQKLLAYLIKEKKFVKLDSSSSCEYFHLVQMETLLCP